MATVAHCLFCFEVLSSSLEKRKCPSLAQVQELWARFESEKQTVQIYDENDSENTEEESGAVEEMEPQGQQGSAAKKLLLPTASLRLPGVSRLRDLSGSGSGSGSNSSTPSTLSTASSRSALTDSSGSSTTNPSSSSESSRRPYALGNREEQYPLFVTWNTISSLSGTKSLRGCIGTFDPTELWHGLKNYALTAAFDDTRFSPISISELPSLSVTITFLINFTPAADPFDWTIGTHGLRVSFSHHARRYHATYLPDVAEEQGWTQEETLVSLMRKAGWTGRSSEWKKVTDLKVVRYEGMRVSLGYKAYMEWERWVRDRKREA